MSCYVFRCYINKIVRNVISDICIYVYDSYFSFTILEGKYFVGFNYAANELFIFKIKATKSDQADRYYEKLDIKTIVFDQKDSDAGELEIKTNKFDRSDNNGDEIRSFIEFKFENYEHVGLKNIFKILMIFLDQNILQSICLDVASSSVSPDCRTLLFSLFSSNSQLDKPKKHLVCANLFHFIIQSVFPRFISVKEKSATVHSETISVEDNLICNWLEISAAYNSWDQRLVEILKTNINEIRTLAIFSYQKLVKDQNITEDIFFKEIVQSVFRKKLDWFQRRKLIIFYKKVRCTCKRFIPNSSTQIEFNFNQRSSLLLCYLLTTTASITTSFIKTPPVIQAITSDSNEKSITKLFTASPTFQTTTDEIIGIIAKTASGNYNQN